jgi:drug/metabolite transporter (DMT)-like permease
MPGESQAADHSIIAGIIFMCLGVISMVALDVTARWLMETFSLPQLVLLRSSFSAVLIFSFVAVRGQLASLRTARPGWQLFRSFLMAGSMFAFFHALRFIPLADVVIIAFAAPIIVTSLSRPLLGETVGVWRWTAVIVGFCGVLVVLRPGSDLMQPAALVALAGSVMYAGLSLTARKLSTTESTASLSLYAFGIPWLLAAAGSRGAWITPGPIDWMLFALCGLFGGLAIVFINAAYQRAAAAVVVPFEYTGLIWAAAAGFFIWDEVPELNDLFGAAIIISSGLVILFRETQIRRRPQPQLDFPLQEVVGAVTGDKSEKEPS